MPPRYAARPARPPRPVPAVLLALAALALALTLPAQAQDGSAPQEQIFPDLTGQALLDALRDSYAPTCGTCQVLGYGPARDSLYRYEQRTDGALTGVYTGFSVQLDPDRDASTDADEKGINAEHTFPQSKGAGDEPARSDLHHLFPAKANVNSSRNNHPYAEIPDAATDTWYTGATSRETPPSTQLDEYSEKANAYPRTPFQGRFEPREEHAGNAARAAFYFFAMYQPRADEAFFRVQLADLLAWHAQDPTDAEEQARSDWIEEKQGTPNPFVLDSTLARRAFEEGTFAGGPGDEGGGGSTAAPGDLVIAELMADPAAVDDHDGEYIELYNRTDASIDLKGYVLADASGNSDQIAYPVVVPPRGVAVLAINGAESENGGVPADYEYSGALSLNQGGDTIFLTAPGSTEITRMSYSDADAHGEGVAFVLADPSLGADGVTEASGTGTASAAAVTAAASRTSDYRAATASYGLGDRGTPGENDFGTLPVELGPFTAQADGRAVLLTWATLSETNNRGFRIERQAGGAWVQAGFRASRAPGGTSAARTRYRFRVEGLSAGRHRFRLAQVDLGGGTPAYSRVVEARLDLGAPYTLTRRGPQPARGDARFQLSVSEGQRVEAAAYDALGRRVAVLFSGRLGAGKRQALVLRRARLASGVYFVRVQGRTFQTTRRVVLVR